MGAIFGPAGNSQAFYDAGYKATIQAFAWLEEMGLDAYEYQCGRGVRVTEETAAALAAEAKQHHIALSLHAPYYISLASVDEAKRENSVRYILESGRAVTRLGGSRIVVHPGGLNGRSREEATRVAMDTLAEAQRALDEEGLHQVHICPETMGKINQLGDLEEVLRMCEVDERFLPCIDFGHMNSRTHGGMNSTSAFAVLLDTLHDRLGEERARRFHAHFSKIEYSAGGEKLHLTFADTLFGPQPEPLMELIARRRLSPVVICESAGTQAADARIMKTLYEQASAGR